MRIRIEEDFLKEIIILIEHTLGDAHVALEGGTRSILMLHHSRKDESGNKRNAERIRHSAVVLIKCVFVDIQSELAVKVTEEASSHVVSLTDDDGIFL